MCNLIEMSTVPRKTLIGVSSAFGVVGAILVALVIYFALQGPSVHKVTMNTLTAMGPVLAGARTAVLNVQDCDPATTMFQVTVSPSASPTQNVQPAALQVQVGKRVNGCRMGELQLQGLEPNAAYTVIVEALPSQGRVPLVMPFETLAPNTPGPVTAVTIVQVPNDSPNPGAELQLQWTPPVMYHGAYGSGSASVFVSNTQLQYLVAWSAAQPTTSGYSSSSITAYDSKPGIWVPHGIPVTISITAIGLDDGLVGPPVVFPTFVPK